MVDFRRPWAGAQVLSDFRAKTARRVDFLRGRSDDDFAAEMQTPVGPAPRSEFISIRIMDAWVHEQDIRRAVNRPGHYDSPAAAHALNRVIRAMPFVAARRAQAPDGATVVIDISGPPDGQSPSASRAAGAASLTPRRTAPLSASALTTRPSAAWAAAGGTRTKSCNPAKCPLRATRRSASPSSGK